jgi:hypothetical protein
MAGTGVMKFILKHIRTGEREVNGVCASGEERNGDKKNGIINKFVEVSLPSATTIIFI